MHKLYLDWIKDKPLKNSKLMNVTYRQYCDIFNNDYNYAFFKPKKDICDLCEQYRLASQEKKFTKFL